MNFLNSVFFGILAMVTGVLVAKASLPDRNPVPPTKTIQASMTSFVKTTAKQGMKVQEVLVDLANRGIDNITQDEMSRATIGMTESEKAEFQSMWNDHVARVKAASAQ